MRIPGLLLGLAILIAPSVHGAQKEGLDLAKTLLDNGVITQEQYDRLQKEALEKEGGYVDVKLTTDGGIQASTYDGKFAFKLGGVFASDLALHMKIKIPLAMEPKSAPPALKWKALFFRIGTMSFLWNSPAMQRKSKMPL